MYVELRAVCVHRRLSWNEKKYVELGRQNLIPGTNKYYADLSYAWAGRIVISISSQ